MRFHAVARLPHLPNPAAEAHSHALHELVLVMSGGYAVRIGRGRLDGRAGDTFYYPPGLRHVPLAGAEGRSQLIIIQWTDVAPESQRRQTCDEDGRLRVAATWLWHLAHSHPPAPAPVLDGLLLALLHQRSLEGHPGSEDDLFERARRYLTANLAYPLSLAELADAMGASPAALHRSFVAHTGQPPMRYRRQLRVEAVVNLLQAGDDRSLAELAKDWGFANAYHLSRIVRQVSGRPPSAWRAS